MQLIDKDIKIYTYYFFIYFKKVEKIEHCK